MNVSCKSLTQNTILKSVKVKPRSWSRTQSIVINRLLARKIISKRHGLRPLSTKRNTLVLMQSLILSYQKALIGEILKELTSQIPIEIKVHVETATVKLLYKSLK